MSPETTPMEQITTNNDRDTSVPNSTRDGKAAPASAQQASAVPQRLSPPRSVPRPTEAEAMEHVRGLLRYIGEDPDREGLLDTPRRVAGTLLDHFRGYEEDPAEYLTRTFSEVEGYNELVLITDIELHSHCEHHMVPFVGKAHIGYIPDGKVIGLSKIARVVDAYAKRLQVQEKLTAQVADAIWEHLQPQGVAVILQCQHFCMCYRGVKKPGSWTTTSKLHGCFLRNSSSRMELFELLGMKREVG